MNKILLDNLVSLISQHIGFHIKTKDYPSLESKIQQRINILKLSGLGDYYKLLKDSIDSQASEVPPQIVYKETKEWNTLANIITNGESFFFRDRGQFKLLQETIIPQIIVQKRQASDFNLKIWSSGCSTGQEPYSLAILLARIINDISQWNITVVGTDINQDFLNKAKTGIYQDWSFRLSDPLFKKKYFTPHKQGWQINQKIKNMVTFCQDNIVQDQILPILCHGVDLILCRNVFIYFERSSVAKGVNKFCSALNHEGYLMTGHAELQGISLNGFKILSFPQSIIYQKIYQENVDNELSAVKSNINLESLALDSSENNILKSLNFESANTSFDDWDYPNSNVLNNQQVNQINISSSKPENNFTSFDKTNQVEDNNIVSSLEKLLAAGKYNQIIEQGKKAIEQQPTNQHFIYHIIAQAYANQNNMEKAELYCKKVLDLDSIFIPSLYLAAQIAESQQNLKKAKEILKRIIYLEPSSIVAYLELGSIYTIENELNRASKMYQTAYEILQDLPSDKIFDYQGMTTASQLITHLKHKIYK